MANVSLQKEAVASARSTRTGTNRIDFCSILNYLALDQEKGLTRSGISEEGADFARRGKKSVLCAGTIAKTRLSHYKRYR